MSSISIASQRFAGLIPSQPLPGDPSSRRLSFPGDRLCECLERDVVPAVQRLWTSPAFKELARKPLRTLLPGCNSSEQALIHELKKSLNETTEITKDFIAENREILDSAFPEAVRHWRRLHGWATTKRDGEAAGSSSQESLPSVDDALRLLQEVQQRCREVWASAEDYFGPSFGTYFLDRAGKYNQRGEFIVDFNPELQAVGNFVARCLMVRATTAIELLTNTIKELQVALVSENFSQTQPWHQPQERTRQLLQDLRQRCLLSDDARLTEAAIILVQIVAEFSVNPPSLEWLSPDLPRDNYPYLRRSLQSKRDPLTGQLVREALATVDQWSKRRPRYESNIDEAIDTGGLVVVEATRQVYWKGELLKVDWKQKHKLPWKLLLSLVKSHWGVTEFDFYGEQDVSDSAYARLKHRLKGVLPADLFSQIHSVTCNDNNAYQIALPVQLIHVFLNEPASRLE